MYKNQIKASLQLDTKVNAIFDGVHACNELTNLNLHKNNACLVILNTAPSTHSGMHWVLFFRPAKGKKMIFFDSFAKSPKEYGECVEKAANYFSSFTQNPNKMILSRKFLQSDDTAVCGLYCIYAAIHLARGKSINSLESKFTSNRTENDKFICKWYTKYFHSKIPLFCNSGQKCVCPKTWK